jgi:hypothetical protein
MGKGAKLSPTLLSSNFLCTGGFESIFFNGTAYRSNISGQAF